jgi:hypothetical protein
MKEKKNTAVKGEPSDEKCDDGGGGSGHNAGNSTSSASMVSSGSVSTSSTSGISTSDVSTNSVSTSSSVSTSGVSTSDVSTSSVSIVGNVGLVRYVTCYGPVDKVILDWSQLDEKTDLALVQDGGVVSTRRESLSAFITRCLVDNLPAQNLSQR